MLAAILAWNRPLRAWFERLTKVLLHFGFKSSKCDPSLFIHTVGGHCTYVLIYVDDIIVIGSSSTRITQLIAKLNSEFAPKQLGDLDYFLGVEVKKLSTGALLLSQTKYIKDFLDKAHMADAKPLPTPMTSSCKLTKFGGNYLPNT